MGANLAIFGKPGSGKTLLAKSFAGEMFYTGTLAFIENGKSVQPSVTYISESHSFKNLSNINGFYYQQRFNSSDADDAGTVWQELKHKGSEEDVKYWLDTFHLTHRRNVPLIQLSNGELKKTQIIRHLLKKPEVIILDKIFTGLDVQSREVMHEVLDRLSRQGTTIILIADKHDLPDCITHFAELGGGRLLNFDLIENIDFWNMDKQEKFSGPVPSMATIEHTGSLIQLKGVNIKYGSKQILQDINWEVLPGEGWQIKGHNGAGKSTLLSIINADNPQAYGQHVYLFGRKRGSGESIWDIKRKTGFVSPELIKYFDKRITVFQVIASGFFDTVGLYKSLTENQREKVNEWIKYFSLTDIANMPLSAISTANQRFVFIARALVKDPLLLAFDEPCQGLDDHQTNKIVCLIDKIHEQTGVAILFISHYDNDVPSCVQNVLELDNGKASIYKRKKIKSKSLTTVF